MYNNIYCVIIYKMKEIIYKGIKNELKEWGKLALNSFLFPLMVNTVVTIILFLIIWKYFR